MAADRSPIISDGLPSQLPDIDAEETNEWLESLDAIIEHSGRHRARYLMLALLQRARQHQVGVPSLRSTDYINTIPPEAEPWFPGDEELERRIRRIVRWNAAIMVHRAQRPGIGVGGHISTYASSASLYEVGFNHFFRGRQHPGGGDQIYFQGHASPGIYARAYLEGRLTEQQLDGFRQELSHAGPGGGLPSYPHPRLMPDFWEFPTVSMGLSPLAAIYQARFNRYLHNRGLKDTSQQHVWAFLGDGEMDEPETIGAITLASREELDNLTFVVNCNLQRLDGPVRGNGKIIQEMEALFRGAGWNVIKVIWGREWDPLLAADTDGALVNLMNETPDGDYQTYKAESGAYVREHFFGRDPRTAKMVEGMTDDQIWGLRRGGHDYRKLYAAYKAATEHTGQPTLILAKTIKGWTLGSHFESRNATHQMKKLTLDDLKGFRDTLHLDIADDALDAKLPPYFHPGTDSDEYKYVAERRQKLGGFVPSRRTESTALVLPGDKVYDVVKRGSGKQPVATTMAFVRVLKDLIKDKEIGPRIVPIIPDEARTFGMDSLFPTLKIYSPQGQNYTPVDRELFLSYKEATDGQILHEGISEAGSVASWTAVGSSGVTHGIPMIPVYIFYSMFGFQRTGDGFWAAADQMARGFVLGATAGRTTLNGEGLQHEDGHSVLLASTNPAVVHYDPAFGFEIGHIVRDGLRRMYGEDAEPVYYYLTVYNEPYVQPAEPEDLDVEGVLKGMYLYKPMETAPGDDVPYAQILASGVGVNWALEAQQRLAEEWEIAADVWSVTSWNELRREAMAADEWNLMHPDEDPRVPYVTQRLSKAPGPVVAVSDFMRAVQDQIAPYVPSGDHGWMSLGTDGFGLSDTRAALRRHFKVDAQSIVIGVLTLLARRGEIPWDVVRKAHSEYRLDDVNATTAQEAGGET
ncbi:MAG TPA: pyruvate dehydrogenase (acetyl-transferring), homodimeric type [Jiangellaceae bacterium]|nr:pyruvate dehydrogenase (acetyl-transferring), homodimeric type [Jiangellaceae bacterium]